MQSKETQAPYHAPGTGGPGTQAVMDALQIVRTAESQLAASEERHRALVDAAVDGIITIDDSGLVLSFNPAAERMFGFAKDEVLGNNISMLVPEPHRQNHDGYINNYLTTGVAKIIGFGREVEGVRKDGSQFPMHLSIGEFSVNGERQFVGIVQDLTQRHLAEQQARKFSAIVESSDDAIIGKDLDGIITSWNRGAQLLYGYQADEVVGQPISILAPNELQNDIAAYIAQVRTGKSVTHVETKRRHKDGSLIDVSLNISPIHDHNGDVIGASAIARDISEQRQTHQKLEYANMELEAQRDETEVQRQELEEINRRLSITVEEARAATVAKSDFLANMSHEIRTPMTAILGYLDIIEEQLNSSRPAIEMLDSLAPIRRSGEHLMSLINDVLDLSKIESGFLELENATISPFQVLCDVLELLRTRASSKGLGLQFECTTPIPEFITSDPQRLRQILFNLIGNAIKFTQTGGVTVRVRLDSPLINPTLRFDVIDTGPGLTDEAIAKIFNPFTQADSTITRQYGGTGLGLSICRKLVESMGGEIGASGQPGLGSTFTFKVPSGHLANTPLKSYDVSEFNRQSKPNPQHSYTLPPCRIMLVEDGIDNQRLIAHILKKAGVTPSVAAHGEEALLLHIQAQEPFDLILMDLQMPVMDGYTATAHLRARGYEGAILALTAHAMKEESQKCIASGFDGFLSKPINKPEFFDAIISHIELARARQGKVKAAPDEGPFRCWCYRRSLDDIYRTAKSLDINCTDAIKQETGCGNQCGACTPYIDLMFELRRVPQMGDLARLQASNTSS